MGELTELDLRRLLDAVYQLGLVTRLDDLPRTVARLAYELVPCDHAGWAVLDFTEGRMSGVHWPDDLSHLFARLPGNLATVPLVPAAAVGPSSTVIRLSDFFTRREFHETPVYNDVYRGIRLEYQIVVPLSFGAPSSSGLRGKRAESMTLGRSDSDFSDRERLLLDEFGRYVRNTARQLRRQPLPSAGSLEQFGLTARQGEALLAVADGATVQSAAAALGVSPKTLENHLQAAYARLGVSNRIAAISRLRSERGAAVALGEIPH